MQEAENEKEVSKESELLRKKNDSITNDLTKTERDNRRKIVAEKKKKRLPNPFRKYKIKGGQINENRAS